MCQLKTPTDHRNINNQIYLKISLDQATRCLKDLQFPVAWLVAFFFPAAMVMIREVSSSLSYMASNHRCLGAEKLHDIPMEHREKSSSVGNGGCE